MRYFLLTLALTFTSLLAGGCSDDTSVNAPRQYFDTTIVSNGFHITGDGYQYAPFALPSEAVAYTTGDGWTTVIQYDIAQRPGRDPEYVSVVLRVPDRRGTFEWANLVAAPSDTSTVFATVEIDGKKYVSVDGSTTVAFFRDVSPDSVTGTFSGTLQSAFGDTVVVEGGRFDAEYFQI